MQKKVTFLFKKENLPLRINVRTLLSWALRLLLVMMTGVLPALAENQVNEQPTTQKPKTASKKEPTLKRLRSASEKALTPNPKFQRPGSTPMPANAPVTPKVAPTPQKSAGEVFLQSVANVMTTTWDNNIFVWLPALSTDPNTGPTYGVLPVLVLSEPQHHHIRHLVAPSYTYNNLFGQTLTGRYYFYPTDQSQLYMIGSYSQHVNRELKIRFEDAAFLGGRAYIRGEGYFDVDGSQRFFGIGPATREGDETGYTGREKVIHGDMGVNFQDNFRFAVGVRYRRFGIDPTIVPGIRDLITQVPDLPEAAQQNTVVQEFHLLWDSRNFPVTPSEGGSGEMFFEKTSLAWGSDSDYIRYGLSGARFIPMARGKQTLVLHGLYDFTSGDRIPFYEAARLGGRETLRGFGEGRFTDKGRILFNIEDRVEVASLSLMNVTTRFEVGPFIDVGTVFPRSSDMQFKYLRPVLGGSFRAVVKPNVVGSVDVGFGNEGVGVYVGINYPF